MVDELRGTDLLDLTELREIRALTREYLELAELLLIKCPGSDSHFLLDSIIRKQDERSLAIHLLTRSLCIEDQRMLSA